MNAGQRLGTPPHGCKREKDARRKLPRLAAALLAALLLYGNPPASARDGASEPAKRNGTEIYEAEGYHVTVFSVESHEDAVRMAAWADRFIDNWLSHFASVERRFEEKHDAMKKEGFRRRESGESSAEYRAAKEAWQKNLESWDIKILDDKVRREVDASLRKKAEHAVSKSAGITVEMYKTARDAMNAAGTQYHDAFEGRCKYQSRSTYTATYGDTEAARALTLDVLGHEISHLLSTIYGGNSFQLEMGKADEFHWLVEGVRIFEGTIARGYSADLEKPPDKAIVDADDYLPAALSFGAALSTTDDMIKGNTLPALSDFFIRVPYAGHDTMFCWYVSAFLLFLRQEHETTFYRLISALHGNIKGLSPDVREEEFTQILSGEGLSLETLEQGFREWVRKTYAAHRSEFHSYTKMIIDERNRARGE